MSSTQFLTQDQYNQIKQMMNSKGIPDYVWVPIMMNESSGNVNANLSNSIEDSRGLFQINIKANPQWKGTNLYDPLTNATIAADHFLSPALYQAGAQGLTNPVDITSYVYKNGIRPAWTTQTANNIANKVKTFLSGGAKGLGLGSGSSGPQPGATTPVQDVQNKASDIINNLIDRFKAFSWSLIPLLLGLIILILVLYKMFVSGSDTINVMTGGEKT